MVKLFVVGFSKEISQIGLLELFSACGTVEKVTIITDKVTGQSKCYGFVTMTDAAGANRAIKALNGITLDRRKLSVRIADDKQKQ